MNTTGMNTTGTNTTDAGTMGHESAISRRRFVSAAALAAAMTGGARRGEAAPNPETPDTAPISARQFGAVGDGVADDTAALQAALDAAFDPDSNAPGDVVIPPGTYKITRTLRITMHENCGRQRRLSGYGARLRPAMTDGGHVLHIRGGSYWHFAIIEGLEIVGGGEEGHGLYLECDHAVHSLYNFCLRDLAVSGCGGDGCRLYGNVFESQLIGCTFRGNAGNGATLAHSPHGGVLSSIQIFGCTFDANESHGAEIVRSYDVGFHGCAFSRNGRFGLLATNGCELVMDCAFVDNHRAAYDFDNGGAGMGLRRYATLVGCRGHSAANQTQLLDADLSGSFARLVMIGCSVTGEGKAATAGLATLRGSSARSAVLVGCRGRVTASGFRPVDIGTAAGGIGVASDWRSTDLLQLGDYRIWVDSRGRMRLKRGMPRSDDDGRPVGGSV